MLSAGFHQLSYKKEKTMRYRLLGRTGVYVSELCLGTMTFGGKGFWEVIGKLTAPESESLIGTALDAGVNFIDTADVYSEGEAESHLGSALAALNRPRDEIVIATKVRGRTGLGPNQIGLSRKHILSAVDASLRRLKLDYIDLYQIHGVDLDTPIEETLRALDDTVRTGKVRYIGYCNLPAWKAMKATAYAIRGQELPGAFCERPDVLFDRGPGYRTRGGALRAGPGACPAPLEPACGRTAFWQVRSGEPRTRGRTAHVL